MDFGTAVNDAGRQRSMPDAHRIEMIPKGA
jgi:hypothetical protein